MSEIKFKECGVLLYKCRNCGGIDESLHVPSVTLALVELEGCGNLERLWPNTFVVRDKGLHCCSNGTTGVSDLIGGRKELEAE